MSVNILVGDVRAKLAELPDESVHCVVTSPPYFGLRDYGHAGQIGLEPTPAAFVATMVEVFREVRRVPRDDGTLWLNLGDSYSSGGGSHDGRDDNQTGVGAKRVWRDGSGRADGIVDERGQRNRNGTKANGLPSKNLIGIPWRVAFALQADGWYLRQDIIWSKPNPMPESVTDRCTKAHEYLFLLSKSPRYYYDADAIAEGVAESQVGRVRADPVGGKSHKERGQHSEGSVYTGKTNGAMKAVSARDNFRRNNSKRAAVHPGQTVGTHRPDRLDSEPGLTRNRRSVWTVATQPFSEAHFATFPPALIEPCILAGCPKDCCAKCGAPVVRQIEKIGGSYAERKTAGVGGPYNMKPQEYQTCGTSTSITTGWSPSCSCDNGTTRGVCLDPFGGAGTTGLVADRHGRSAILIELSPEYADLARNRISADAGMFADVA